MSHIPTELKYSKTHEWARLEEDGTVIVGITDHAQELLGDLVYVELPAVGGELKAGTEVGVVESVKSASDIYCPVSGEILAINESLRTNPELINQDPYGEGWIFKLQPEDEDELNTLLSVDTYQDIISSEAN